MADLVDNRHVPKRENGAGWNDRIPLIGVTNHPTAGAFRTYSGDLMISQAATPGYAYPFKSGTTIASGDVFHGVSEEAHLVEGADDGEQHCLVNMSDWIGFAVGPLTQADVGKVVYATDAETLTLTALNNLPVGVLKKIDTWAWVDIGNYAGVAVA